MYAQFPICLSNLKSVIALGVYQLWFIKQ